MEKNGFEISKYNNIIIPVIAMEIFNLSSVEYLYAKFSYGKHKISVNPNLEYLITFDEKITGEEIWEGWNIIFSHPGEDTLVFSKRLDEVGYFLRFRNVSTHKIYEVTDELIRQELFKKIVEFKDNHNGNWAIGIKNRTPRAFPVYDFDFCTGIRGINIYETLDDNGKSDLKSFIKQYRYLPWMKKYIEEVIKHFSMENVFNVVFEKTGIILPENVKTHFANFYEKKKNELQKIYYQIIAKNNREDDDLCV